MSTDLFISQLINQIQPDANQSDKTGATGLDRSSKPATTELSSKGDGANFSTTLIEIFQDRFAQNSAIDAGWPGSSESPIDLIPANDEDTGSVHMPAERYLPELCQILQKMGHHSDIDGSDWQNMAGGNAVDGDDLAALQMLIVGFQKENLAPTPKLKAGFERLGQLIAKTRVAKTMVPTDGKFVKGLASNQVSIAAQINQILRNTDPGRQNPKLEPGVSAGQGISNDKLSGPIPNETKIGAAGVGKSADQADNKTSLPISIKRDATKPSSPISTGASRSENGGEVNSNDKADADSAKTKNGLSFAGDTRSANRPEFANRMPPPADNEKQKNIETMRDNQPLKQNPPSGMNRNVGNVSESSIQSLGAGEPQSKVFQETQPARGWIKTQLGPATEKSSQVIKTEAGTSENGLLNSPSQNTEKSAETGPSSKELETGQSSLRTQTMDQIVRRAVIQLRNGQHEARIDLRPEFLGHIRMQVVSENQQVTVKILAEHGFVKDMIENNAHQLKADLQQHGLEIDKLEVSVSRDSEDSGSPRENLAGSKGKPGASDRKNEPRPAEKNIKDKRQPVPTSDSAQAVDFFA
ncbi:MAG: flagellar hook-length control protein FliK [Deltaproteobacteria bacterium]|nr:flagellar hook-length control protein FliK [Deltaproteobacteria bacterium]